MIVGPKRCDGDLYRARDKARPFLCLYTATGCSSRALSICLILYGNSPLFKVISSTVSSVQGLNPVVDCCFRAIAACFSTRRLVPFPCHEELFYFISVALLFVLLVIDSNRAIKNTLYPVPLKIEACTSQSFPILLWGATI